MAVEGQRASQSFSQGYLWFPAQDRTDPGIVSVVIPDVNAPAVRWERTNVILTPTIGLDQKVCQLFQADDAIAAQVERLTVSFFALGGHQESVYRIIHISEIPLLMPVPHIEGFTFNQQADPDTQEGLTSILHPHARPVGVRQAQGTGTDAIDVVVEDVVPLPGHLVDAVYVHRA